MGHVTTEERADQIAAQVMASYGGRFSSKGRQAIADAAQIGLEDAAQARRRAHAARWEGILGRPRERELTDVEKAVVDVLYRFWKSGTPDLGEIEDTGRDFGDWAMEVVKTSKGTDDPIPLYAQLDVWMALYGPETSQAFEKYAATVGFADRWSEILGVIRDNVAKIAQIRTRLAKPQSYQMGEDIAQILRGDTL